MLISLIHPGKLYLRHVHETIVSAYFRKIGRVLMLQSRHLSLLTLYNELMNHCWSSLKGLAASDLWLIRICGNSCWNVVSDKLRTFTGRFVLFFCAYTRCTSGAFPPLSCVCRTMSSGSGCSAVGQLCAGREGSGRDGMREEAALCGHILFDSGPFHKPPNSCCCCRLHVFDCLLVESAWFVSLVYFNHKMVWNSQYLLVGGNSSLYSHWKHPGPTLIFNDWRLCNAEMADSFNPNFYYINNIKFELFLLLIWLNLLLFLEK